VDTQVDEDLNCKLVPKKELIPIEETVGVLEPFEYTNTTQHCVLTNVTKQPSVELVEVKVGNTASPECGKFEPGGNCEPLIPATPIGNVPVDETVQYGEPTTVVDMTCYKEVSSKITEEIVYRDGHAFQVVEKVYRVCTNTTETVQDFAGEMVTTKKALGNPCPNNCADKQPGCIPCAA